MRPSSEHPVSLVPGRVAMLAWILVLAACSASGTADSHVGDDAAPSVDAHAHKDAAPDGKRGDAARDASVADHSAHEGGRDAFAADTGKDSARDAYVGEGGAPLPEPCPTTAPNVQCDGDAATDATPCLQAALSGALTTLVLPAGKTYLISATLSLPTGKSLVGNGSTIFSQVTAATTLLRITGDGASVCGVDLSQRGTAADAPLLDISAGVTHISFTNSTVTGTGPIGLYLGPGGPTGFVLIQGNTFSGTTYPILLNATSQGSSRSNYQHDIVIDRNTITGARADAVEINSPVFNLPQGSQLPGISVYNITITNNQMSQQGEFGIGFAGGTDSVIAGNTITDTGVPPGSANIQGIHIEDHASNVQVVSNTIKNTTGTTTYDSAIELIQSDHIYLYGNSVNNTTTGSGIELSWDPSGNHESECIVAGNHIVGSGNFGINAGGLRDAAVDTVIGPSHGYGGNTSADSGKPGNQAGQGSINITLGNGIVVSGNSGN